MLKISVHKYTIFNNMMMLLAQSSSVRYLTELNELENAVAERFLKHVLGFALLENIFTRVFLRQTQSLFTESDELVPELSTEVWISSVVSVTIRPVELIFLDTVLSGEEEIPDAFARMSGENLKSRHVLIHLDGSSCQTGTDDPATIMLFSVNLREILNHSSPHFALKRGDHVKPCVLAVAAVLGPCDQLILSFHHNIND